jgi:16S rRNA (adenine(1408)-N(1))-methyltransferase
VSLDLGTGDGRLPLAWAREQPQRLFIGLDANAKGLRLVSGRASRERTANLLYVRAAVESLPRELDGIADRVTVVLPWGSLLAAVALPTLESLRRVRAACQPGAELTVVLGTDPARDRAELQRLGLPSLEADALATRVEAGYRDAGFRIERVRPLPAAELQHFRSSWARRLAFGGARAFVQLGARAV